MADTKQGRTKKALREAKAAELRAVEAYFEHGDAPDDDIDEQDIELDPAVRAAYLAEDEPLPYLDLTDD